MESAFRELSALGADGIQLTPGNHPSAEFRAHTDGTTVRRHHGFSFEERVRAPWCDETGACLCEAESVHPPKIGSGAALQWRAWYEHAAQKPLIEGMYPGYVLGTGAELIEAMRDAMPLAIDVSHIWLQLRHGVMDEATWRRIADYDHIGEVHLSANAGRHDTHEPLAEDSFGLRWARERLRSGTPVVLECYMHRMPRDTRLRQIELARGES
ncbi:MAG: hypothetical protein ACXVEE_35900 [Polyangiales bacterium]